MKKLLIASTLLLLLQGCGGTNATTATASPTAPTQEISSEILHASAHNQLGKTTEKGARTILNQEGYKSELSKRSSNPIKPIDFNTESLLLVDMGTKNSGGHSINVSFTDSGNAINANITYTSPGPRCMVTFALTNPYQFIKLKTKKAIIITEKFVAKDC